MMNALAQCLSHSPVVHLRPLDAARQSIFEGAVEDAKQAMTAFAPDVVVVFGPDHYNGFFYNLMPPFCVGAEAVGIGDYLTLKGALGVDTTSATGLHRHLLKVGFDAALSYDMHVDHGFTQAMVQLFDRPPLFVPVFVNCVAQPLAPCSRVIAFGRALGDYFRSTGKKIAFIGSGGLSHDAPLPSLASVEGEARKKLIEWRMLTPTERAEREQRTLAAADQFALGSSPLAKLSPGWDRQVMHRIAVGNWPLLGEMQDDDLTATAGRSAHEVRTWLAAFSALSAFGSYKIEQDVYLEIPEWIVGYGALRGRA